MERIQNSFSKGLRDGLPICLGYIPVSFAFGIFAVESGLSIWQAFIISMTNLTSAGQLAGVPIIAGGLPLTEMALTQLVINMRYALMSMSLTQKFSHKVKFIDRFLFSFFNTDEIFGVASSQFGLLGRRYLYGLVIAPFFGWTLGTLFGAIAGNVLPDIVTSALGIAIYGMFIAIIMPVAKRNKPVLGTVFLACGLSLIFTFVPVLNKVSSGFAIIICAVVSSLIFALLCPIKEVSHE